MRGNSTLDPRTPSPIMRKSLWATMTIIDLYATVYLAVSPPHPRSSIQVLCLLLFRNHCPPLMLTLRFSPIRGRHLSLGQLELTDIHVLRAAWHCRGPQRDRS